MLGPRKLRMTPQRQAILDAVRQTEGHPTADDIYRAVRGVLPSTSLGTVYRNLSLLAEAGLVRQIGNGSGPSRFDGDLSHHYHVRCTMCEQVDDVRPEFPRDLDEAARGVTDYDVIGHRLEFLGICPSCRDRAQ